MKTKNLLLITLICLGFLINACNKDHPQKKPAQTIIDSVCNISSISSDPSDGYDIYDGFYIYDDRGRLTSFAKNTITYKGDTVYIKNDNKYGFLGEKKEILLDDKGNAIFSKYLATYMVATDVFERYVKTDYFYSADGYLIKELRINSEKMWTHGATPAIINETYVYEYKDGNLIKKQYSTSSGTNAIWNYTYTDLNNQLGPLERKILFNGKQSKNLVKISEQIWNSNPPLTLTHNYKIDGNGKLESDIITNGLDKIIKNYKWLFKS